MKVCFIFHICYLKFDSATARVKPLHRKLNGRNYGGSYFQAVGSKSQLLSVSFGPYLLTTVTSISDDNSLSLLITPGHSAYHINRRTLCSSLLISLQGYFYPLPWPKSPSLGSFHRNLSNPSISISRSGRNVGINVSIRMSVSLAKV
jgi:hypothetical protein